MKNGGGLGPAQPPAPGFGPAPGTIVVDERTERVGVVMDSVGPYVQLRPLNGGREWDVAPDRIRTASTDERLRASVSAANERSAQRAREQGRGC